MTLDLVWQKHQYQCIINARIHGNVDRIGTEYFQKSICYLNYKHYRLNLTRQNSNRGEKKKEIKKPTSQFQCAGTWCWAEVPSLLFSLPVWLQEQLHSYRHGLSTGVGCSWVSSPLFLQFSRTTVNSSQILYIPLIAYVQDPSHAQCVEGSCVLSAYPLYLQSTSVRWQPVANLFYVKHCISGAFPFIAAPQGWSRWG